MPYKQLYLSSSGYKTHNVHNMLDDSDNTEKLKWNALYDGSKANVDVDLVKNGEEQHYNMTLNNNELKQLYNDVFTHPAVHMSLEQRLLKAYPLEQSQPSLPGLEPSNEYRLPIIVTPSPSRSRSRSSSSSRRSSSKRRKTRKPRRTTTRRARTSK